MSEAAVSKNACIAAWAAAILIPSAILVGTVWPLVQRSSALDDEIASLGDQITRLHRLLDTLPGLRVELEQVRSNEDVKAFYFDAQTPALAGAELQRQLKQIVKEADGRLISTQILPAVEDEQPPRVRVRTQLQGKTDTLLDVLFRIEQARPFLFVDQASVRATAPRAQRRNPRVRGRRAQDQVRRQGQLTVRLDIFGFALGEVH